MIVVDRDVLRQTHTVVATVLVIVFSRHYVDFGMEDETKKVGR
jgi:hypothetical protein